MKLLQNNFKVGLNLRRGLPSWLSGKKFACQQRRHRRCGFDPWIGKIPWRRKWQPIPVFLTGESHEQRSLAGNSPSGHRELDTTEQLSMHTHEPEKVQTWEGSKPFWLSFSTYEVKWKSLTCVQLFVTPWTTQSMEFWTTQSTARILEWVAFPFSRGFAEPRDWTQVSLTAGGLFTSWAAREAFSTYKKQHYSNGHLIRWL